MNAGTRPNSVWRFVRTSFCIGAVIYLVVCAGCASFQRRMIYFPPVFDTAKTDELGKAVNLERWTRSDGKPLGWKRPSPVQPSSGQALILHGNGGCAVWSSRFVDAIQRTVPLDVFIVEYPGYADVPGKPTERSLQQSANEAFESLAARAPVYLLGESLGTGVATYLAGRHPEQTCGIILFAPFNTLVDVAKFHAPVLPVRWMLRDRYPSEEHLKFYHGPIAVLVGGEDRVVPAKFGQRLYDGYAGPKRLWDTPQGNHGTVMDQPPETWKQIFAFLQSPGEPLIRADLR